MDFESEINRFKTKHRVSFFNIKPGFFISPVSSSNLRNKNQLNTLLLRKYTFLDVYRIKFKHVVNAVTLFMRLNKIPFNKEDDVTFSKNMAILYYFLSIYLRRMRFEDINIDKIDLSVFEKFMIRHEVKKMYRDLFRYLTDKKGLTDSTAKKILYDAESERQHGLENIIFLLNSLEQKFYSENDTTVLKKKLIRDVSGFNLFKPSANEIGKIMESVTVQNTPFIREHMMSITRATDAIILSFDTDQKIKSKLSNSGLKVPDFIYFDNLMNCIPLDSKFNLDYADSQQVSPENLKKVFSYTKLNLTN